jgi:hypothetical protein
MERVYEGYRYQAEYCERKAESAPTPEIRASWRRLAEEWLSLIPTPELMDSQRDGQRELI